MLNELFIHNKFIQCSLHAYVYIIELKGVKDNNMHENYVYHTAQIATNSWYVCSLATNIINLD